MSASLHSPFVVIFAAAVIGSGLCSAPLFAQCQTAKLVPSTETPNDWGGYASAISGDVAVFGAQFHNAKGAHSGTCYVFRREGRDWNQEAELYGSDTGAGDLFGAAVSLDGDVLLIGASQDDTTFSNAGSAYVFRYNGTSWLEEAKLTASDPAADDTFGTAVRVRGNVAIVGALFAGNNLTGAAYIYRFDGTSWNQEAKVTASDSVTRDAFGYSVGIDGDVAVVGAYYSEGSLAGKSYVYRFDGSQWLQEQVLVPFDDQNFNYFGISSAIDGDVIVVGAQGNNDIASRAGKAYVFRFDGALWKEEDQLVASDAAAFDAFGVAVDIEDTRIVVGCTADDEAATNAGAVYLYEYDGVNWTQTAKMIASDALAIDELGRSVGISGEFILGGAFWADAKGVDSGAAYVFLRGDAVASWNNYGVGWPGTLGVPAFTLSDDPVLGSTIQLQIDNSLGVNTSGMLVIGFAQSSLPTNLGGTLLVLPFKLLPLALITAPSMSFNMNIGCNPNLLGASAYLQVLEFDAGASDGVSFSRGLQMNIGF